MNTSSKFGRRGGWSVAAGVVFALAFAGTGSVAGPSGAAAPAGPVDAQATAKTRALYRSLASLQGRAMLFGHQDDLAYGHDWSAVDGRSDVKDVAGDYPSVLGFDMGRLETGATANIDGVRFDDMRRWIRQGYDRGSVGRRCSARSTACPAAGSARPATRCPPP